MAVKTVETRFNRGEWVNQEDMDIMSVGIGLTLLVKFKDDMYGITSNDESCIDISWLRQPSNNLVITESIHCPKEEITEYKFIL